MAGAHTNREAVTVEAADWLARLDAAGDDPSLAAAFEAWRTESPAHALAVARLRHVLDLSGRMTADQPPPAAVASARRPGLAARRAWTGGAIAASLAAAAVAAFALFGPGASYATGVGERRLISLGGGAFVELNTDSRVRVSRRGRTRVVSLQKGEMLVTLRRGDEEVELDAAGRQLAARDASVDVRLLPHGLEVAALQGQVRAKGGGDRPAVVDGGQIATLGADAGSLSLVSAPQEVQRRLAWRDGRLEFDGQTLGEVAAEFNRYNQTKLSVSPSVANLRVGGVFDALAPEAFARSTALVFGLQVQPTADGERLGPATSPAA